MIDAPLTEIAAALVDSQFTVRIVRRLQVACLVKRRGLLSTEVQVGATHRPAAQTELFCAAVDEIRTHDRLECMMRSLLELRIAVQRACALDVGGI